ncbi:hypothetical protein C8R47DRAFT_1083567 [Mycena vitilis]|nr:hypothetical protein C8R47DRAFT_1083567 [Mycena vitilis]
MPQHSLCLSLRLKRARRRRRTYRLYTTRAGRSWQILPPPSVGTTFVGASYPPPRCSARARNARDSGDSRRGQIVRPPSARSSAKKVELQNSWNTLALEIPATSSLHTLGTNCVRKAQSEGFWCNFAELILMHPIRPSGRAAPILSSTRVVSAKERDYLRQRRTFVGSSSGDVDHCAREDM